MKQPKKLTREQKIALMKARRDPQNWMLAYENKTSWTFISKKTSEVFVLEKE